MNLIIRWWRQQLSKGNAFKRQQLSKGNAGKNDERQFVRDGQLAVLGDGFEQQLLGSASVACWTNVSRKNIIIGAIEYCNGREIVASEIAAAAAAAALPARLRLMACSAYTTPAAFFPFALTATLFARENSSSHSADRPGEEWMVRMEVVVVVVVVVKPSIKHQQKHA
jgi:hypothetical protein